MCTYLEPKVWLSVGSWGFFLTFVSTGMGEDDLDDAYWSCEEDMKPESWEEMLESRAGACWGSVELRYRWRAWWWWKRWCEEEEEEEEEGEWEWEPLDPLESLLLTLFRLLWKGKGWEMRRWPEGGEVWQLQTAWRESSAPKDMDRRRKKEIKRNNEGRGLGGGMWRRQGGKQLTQHTKMQQAVTEANPVKTTT